MIYCEIDTWKLQKIYAEENDLYESLYSLPEAFFDKRPDRYKQNQDGSISYNYSSMAFYVNELEKMDPRLWVYCTFSPVKLLEMMEGARINTDNVFEAAKRNQIMLPNNLMLEMAELRIETDQCTEEINNLLHEGWKLIAVLPQHQQRRPDYLLGRSK